MGEPLNHGIRWLTVTCRGCGKSYQCTPEDDYYNASPGNTSDGQCFACMLRDAGIDPDKTQVMVVDEHGRPWDPRDLAVRENYERRDGR